MLLRRVRKAGRALGQSVPHLPWTYAPALRDGCTSTGRGDVRARELMHFRDRVAVSRKCSEKPGYQSSFFNQNFLTSTGHFSPVRGYDPRDAHGSEFAIGRANRPLPEPLPTAGHHALHHYGLPYTRPSCLYTRPSYPLLFDCLLDQSSEIFEWHALPKVRWCASYPTHHCFHESLRRLSVGKDSSRH